jgi:Putative transposase
LIWLALLEVAADPKHLGAEIGFFSVLHTWGQNLLAHPHVHCVIPAGGLASDHTHWIHPRYPFFLPVGVLSRIFRGKFVAGLKRRFHQHQLTFAGTLKPDANEAPWQYVQQEASQELLRGKGHLLFLISVRVILPAEGNLVALEGDKAMVGNGDPMGVAGEVTQHMMRSAEGWLGVDDPVLTKQRTQERAEGFLVF